MAKYFDDSEFACKCCEELPENGMNEVLVSNLDKLREMYGKPIYCSCGYRCPKHNLEVGSFRGSQHEIGNAVDVYVDGDYEEFYQLCLDSELFDGVGHYPYDEFVHLDCRLNGTMPNYYQWED